MKKHLLFFVAALFMVACGPEPVIPPVTPPDSGDSTEVETPTVATLDYQLTEFEGDRFGIKAYNYNVIFTKGETDFQRQEVDLGGQLAYQYTMSKGTAYMLYLVSKQQRNEVPADGTYHIGYYLTDPNNKTGNPPFMTLCRGYNGAASMSEMTGGQHAPMGSFRMHHPGVGEYWKDYTDDDVYRYVTNGSIVIKTNDDGTYTWDVNLTFTDFTSEELTWTGKYK